MTPVRHYNRARRKTGEPSRLEKSEPRRQPEEPDIEAQITALEALSISDLRIRWQQLYRATPPTRLSRDLLVRGIAYLVQECALGGLSASTKRRLRSLAAGSEQRRGAGDASVICLRRGTKLVREWHQKVHTVSVLDNGYEYQGERYSSLSRIARRITGVSWSGPRFFGVSKPLREEAENPRG
jgi:hypothetical protein